MNRRLFLSAIAAALAAWPNLAAASGKKEGGKKEEKKDGGTYIQIETLTAFTIKPSGRRGVMTIDCGLDVPDPKLNERVQLLLPRIRAAFVQAAQVYAGGLPAGAPPSPDFLALNLQRAADQAIGRPGAKVLIGALVVN